MDELVQQLKANAGITDEQALKVIETMKEFIHSKIPPAFSGFVDTFFANSSTAAGGDDSYLG